MDIQNTSRCSMIALPIDGDAELMARLWSFVDVPRHRHWRTACWEWRGAITRAWSKFGGNGSGYGTFTVRGPGWRKTYRAHRLVAEMTLRRPIGDALVLHSCDNRKCVNPRHLRLGTHSENLVEQYVRERRKR